MFTKTVTISLYIPAAGNLKEKRQVIQSIIARLRKFNVSVAEVGFQEQWQRAELGLAMVGVDLTYLDGLRQQIIRLIEDDYPVEITAQSINDY